MPPYIIPNLFPECAKRSQEPCKTWVLVADFDKEGWQKETALYRNACRAFGLTPAVERSRSGNGSHVWLFFEEPIDAELARNLGCALITHAMSQAAGMSFESYDRFFPTQSTIPEGGFGNLIALPFQGRPQRQSNSVFVDDGFMPYPDQWRFLSSVTKASPQQVREIVDSPIGGPLGQLAFASHPSRKTGEPTETAHAAVSLQAFDSTSADFPKTVRVTRANMLFVSKQGLSNKAQNRVRRLAAFGNPEFYKAQAMHRSVIGQIGGGKKRLSGIVDIATFQSLSAKDDLGMPHAKPVVGDYELVICDECHNGAAPNYELVMKSVNARRVYGLSATPKRSDGLERAIFMHCGPVRHKVDPKEQAADQGFRRILKPRFTRIRLASLEPGASFNQVTEALCEHNARNALIAEDVISAVKSGRTPLVITNRKEHATEFARLLGESGIETYVLTGEGTAREKRERIERVRNAADTRYAIIATGAYIGEGFDLPQLDTLLLASPYSHEGVITQYSGRLHRESEGKDDVIVYDYVDASVPMLERMYKKRLKTYAHLGYEIAEADEAQGPGARIVTASAWRAELAMDLSCAGKAVIVSAPYANPNLVESLLPEFAGAIARGIEVRVILRKPKSEKSLALQSGVSSVLTNAGCKVAICDAPLTGIAVFDDRIAWYGTLPLLAFAKADDCCLRVESAEVATDLEKALEDSTMFETHKR